MDFVALQSRRVRGANPPIYTAVESGATRKIRTESRSLTSIDFTNEYAG